MSVDGLDAPCELVLTPEVPPPVQCATWPEYLVALRTACGIPQVRLGPMFGLSSKVGYLWERAGKRPRPRARARLRELGRPLGLVPPPEPEGAC